MVALSINTKRLAKELRTMREAINDFRFEPPLPEVVTLEIHTPFDPQWLTYQLGVGWVVSAVSPVCVFNKWVYESSHLWIGELPNISKPTKDNWYQAVYRRQYVPANSWQRVHTS